MRLDDRAGEPVGQIIGFRPKGVRRGYYTDNREDALIMWRDAEPDEEEAPGA